jgi:ribosomal protein L11 methyltransferase
MLAWRKLSSAKWVDSWQESLGFMGPQRLAITQIADSSRIRLEIFELTNREANLLLKRFGGEVRDLKRSTADWVRSVVLRKPVSIRGKLRIVAQSAPSRSRFLNRDIFIPANLAFGTGEHATTAACLRFLCDNAPKDGPWSFLDVGTGTGVLAIAAAKLGATRAEAIDYDAAAVRIAKENASSNGVPQVHIRRVDVRKYEGRPTFDLVAANLYGELFKQVARRIWRAVKPGGFLIVSGIMRDQTVSVQSSLERLGATLLRTSTRGKWVTLLASKQRW